MKLNKKRLIIAGIALASFTALLGTTIVLLTHPDLLRQSAAGLNEPVQEEIRMKYGFVLNNFDVVEAVIERNQFLSEILQEYKVSYNKIDALDKAAQGVFPLNKLKAGKDYMLLVDKKTGEAQYFIYEPNSYGYIVYDLSKDKPTAYKVDRKVDIIEKTASGVIESSLWDALGGGELSYMLAVKMEDALKCEVDFFHVHKGDRFKLIYTEKVVEGTPVGVDELLAAYVNFGGKETYVYNFQNEKLGIDGFYDQDGRPMKQAYLKSPVEYARISSPFNMKRFHPILKYVRPHLGTDYAAPEGTPIHAIAEGVVEAATRSGGNGIYVKIRHDKVYESQYLHMCRHAKGIREGMRVKQGEIIGYVGQTGLATGPHVCFRFWKNGEQVDFMKQDLPRSTPIEGEPIKVFAQLRDSMKIALDKMPFSQTNDLSIVVMDTLSNP